MGSCVSKDSAAETETLPPQADSKQTVAEEQAPIEDLADFVLKKLRPECTGMFWRSDPRGKEQLTGGHNWPQDNATLRGLVIVHDGEKWLKAYKVKQVGGKWLEVPQGAYMPFEHDDHYYLDPVSA